MNSNLNHMMSELRQSLSEIELQIKNIKNDIKLEYPHEYRERINVWYWTRRPDGRYILEDLLVAKANLLASIANLEILMRTGKK